MGGALAIGTMLCGLGCSAEATDPGGLAAPAAPTKPAAAERAPKPGHGEVEAAVDQAPPIELPPFDPRRPPHWIAAASGAVPELNQVSLEQDMALAAEVFGDGGRVLFGSGPKTATVQVLAPDRRSDPVSTALGELFSPRSGRGLRYRPTRLRGADPATVDTVLAAIDHAIAGGPDPLLLYLGGHGNIGEQARFNSVSLWEQSDLTVAELAGRLDRSPRPVRLVVTTCFSGGFGELAFRDADPSQGATVVDRCGLFAAPWDLEATGCDPNPDRAGQEGYGLHFLNALRGRDRGGQPLPKGALDLDGDGAISLLEAHTRARIASPSADIPTTTTERWLRHAAPPQGPEQPVALPEEDAVVHALAKQLGLEGRASQAYVELQRFDDDLEGIGRRLEEAQWQEDQAYRIAAADLLARWPVLDDPWHPEQPRVIATHREAIAGHLEQSDSYAQYLDARAAVDGLHQRLWDTRRSAAPYERLTRALDNRKLARRLHAKGGDDWSTYERMLACERFVPRTAP